MVFGYIIDLCCLVFGFGWLFCYFASLGFGWFRLLLLLVTLVVVVFSVFSVLCRYAGGGCCLLHIVIALLNLLVGSHWLDGLIEVGGLYIACFGGFGALFWRLLFGLIVANAWGVVVGLIAGYGFEFVVVLRGWVLRCLVWFGCFLFACVLDFVWFVFRFVGLVCGVYLYCIVGGVCVNSVVF